MQCAIVVACTWYLTSASAVLTQLMNCVNYLLSTWIQSRWQRTGPCWLPALTFVCARHHLLLTRPCLQHVVATCRISPHLFLFWVGPHGAPTAPLWQSHHLRGTQGLMRRPWKHHRESAWAQRPLMLSVEQTKAKHGRWSEGKWRNCLNKGMLA